MKDFKDRLQSQETILCAEGYIYELERRGYCSAGPYVPQIVLEKPSVVQALHEEFAHAGSEVLVACQYYANKQKMIDINIVDQFEKLNRQALMTCHQVAQDTNTFAAGNLCNSCEYNSKDATVIQNVRDMFREQVVWAQEIGVDLFVCETFREYGEASLALRVAKEYAPEIPCVVSLVPHSGVQTKDGLKFAAAFDKLIKEGAEVVGLNCARGPETMMDVVRQIRKDFKGPMMASPVPYRTTSVDPTWLTLKDPKTGESAMLDVMETLSCSCKDITEFGKSAMELNLKWVGICCGNSSRYTRALGQSIGRKSEADKYSSRNHLNSELIKDTQMNGGLNLCQDTN